MRTERQWVSKSVQRLLADQNRSADTHMILFSLPLGGECLRVAFGPIRRNAQMMPETPLF